MAERPWAKMDQASAGTGAEVRSTPCTRPWRGSSPTARQTWAASRFPAA